MGEHGFMNKFDFKKIKKNYIFAALFVCLFLYLFNRFSYNPDRIAKRLNTTFIAAVNTKDTNKIKRMMCKYTLEINDIDQQIEKLFEYFEEERALPIEISEVTGIDRHSERASVRDGVLRKAKVNAHMTINSKNGKKYDVVMNNYFINEDKKNEGVSRIAVYDITGLEGKELIDYITNNPDNLEVGILIE